MAELDVDRIIQDDRTTPLPGQSEVSATLAAVRLKVSREGERAVRSRLRSGSPQPPWMIAVTGAATALGVALILSSSPSWYLLLVIPSIELVALKALIEEEAKL